MTYVAIDKWAEAHYGPFSSHEAAWNWIDRQILEENDRRGRDNWEVTSLVLVTEGRCKTSIHPGTSRVGFACVLSAGHSGEHDYGSAYKKHKEANT